MITIATFDNASEAYVAKGLLEANGITCQLKNDLVAQTLPIGGVELQVAVEHAEQARQLLESTAEKD